MSAHAFISGIAKGTPTPPVPSGCVIDDSPPPGDWPWRERFSETDYDTLYHKYNDFADVVTSEVPPSAHIVVNACAITLQGATPQAQFGGGISTLATPVLEFWVRIQMEMVGGAFDGPFTTGNGGAVSVDCYTDDSEVFFTSDNVFGDSLGTYRAILWPDATRANTGVSRALPAGPHTFIMCVSEDSPTVQRAEVWVDASPGDTPATNTSSKTAGDGFYILNFNLFGPVDPARFTKVTDISFIGSNRASDPFGIL